MALYSPVTHGVGSLNCLPGTSCVTCLIRFSVPGIMLIAPKNQIMIISQVILFNSSSMAAQRVLFYLLQTRLPETFGTDLDLTKVYRTPQYDGGADGGADG